MSLYNLFANVFSIMCVVECFVIMIALYVWGSLMEYFLLKKMNHPYAWFAWIPILDQFAIAEATATSDGVSSIQIFNMEIEMKLFRFYPVLAFIISFIPMIGRVASILLTIICFGSNITTIYSLLENRPQEEVKLLGYLSGLIGLIFLIKLSIYKSKKII